MYYIFFAWPFFLLIDKMNVSSWQAWIQWIEAYGTRFQRRILIAVVENVIFQKNGAQFHYRTRGMPKASGILIA